VSLFVAVTFDTACKKAIKDNQHLAYHSKPKGTSHLDTTDCELHGVGRRSKSRPSWQKEYDLSSEDEKQSKLIPLPQKRHYENIQDNLRDSSLNSKSQKHSHELPILHQNNVKTIEENKKESVINNSVSKPSLNELDSNIKTKKSNESLNQNQCSTSMLPDKPLNSATPQYKNFDTTFSPQRSDSSNVTTGLNSPASMKSVVVIPRRSRSNSRDSNNSFYYKNRYSQCDRDNNARLSSHYKHQYTSRHSSSNKTTSPYYKKPAFTSSHPHYDSRHDVFQKNESYSFEDNNNCSDVDSQYSKNGNVENNYMWKYKKTTVSVTPTKTRHAGTSHVRRDLFDTGQLHTYKTSMFII
jgi:hypothetical protein